MFVSGPRMKYTLTEHRLTIGLTYLRVRVVAMELGGAAQSWVCVRQDAGGQSKRPAV